MIGNFGSIYEKPYILQYALKLVQELKGVVNMQYGNLNQTPAKSVDEIQMCQAMSNLFIIFRQEIKEILKNGKFTGMIDFNE